MPVPRSTWPLYAVTAPASDRAMKICGPASSRTSSAGSSAGGVMPLSPAPAGRRRAGRRAGSRYGCRSGRGCSAGPRDFRLGRVGVAVQQRLRRHDHSVHAVAALRGLFGDEGLLHRVRGGAGAEALERHDLPPDGAGDRQHAAAGGEAVHDDGAGAAFAQAAAEFRPVEPEVVAQHVSRGVCNGMCSDQVLPFTCSSIGCPVCACCASMTRPPACVWRHVRVGRGEASVCCTNMQARGWGGRGAGFEFRVWGEAECSVSSKDVMKPDIRCRLGMAGAACLLPDMDRPKPTLVPCPTVGDFRPNQIIVGKGHRSRKQSFARGKLVRVRPQRLASNCSKRRKFSERKERLGSSALPP